ncbi:MAG: response regulator transcription factor [Defluviitaleaceae bacterium]|nr:response regulator transcription factor [Defluviitaleaceae bacterium]
MSAKNKILIIEDDPHIAELIAIYLNKEGYETLAADSGRKAVDIFLSYSPQLVLLDLMLPGTDGYQVCRDIRRESDIPVIMLTAKSETFDKVLGLELGADDYITKPFEPKELVARVKAVLRRYGEKSLPQDNLVALPNLTVNRAAMTVSYHGAALDLPRKEFELFLFLVTHPNVVYTREQLLEHVWGFDFYGETRTVDVHIKRLREKMTEPDGWGIKTVRSVGYKFEN